MSSGAAAIGFGFALVVGITAGLALGTVKALDDLLAPFISAVMAVPSVAYIPVIMIWFGIGATARTVVIFEFALWVVLINVRTGVRSVDPTLIDMARSFGLSRLTMFWRIVLPATVPAMFAGVRLGIVRGLKGMVTAEMLMTLVGVGGLMRTYGASFFIDRLLALVFTIIAIGIVLTAVLQWTDGMVNRWQKGTGLRE